MQIPPAKIKVELCEKFSTQLDYVLIKLEELF